MKVTLFPYYRNLCVTIHKIKNTSQNKFDLMRKIRNYKFTA